jgi:outer membrane receptor protein involved in Fe transport
VQYNHDGIGEPADAVTTNIDYVTPKFDWAWTIIYEGPTMVNPNAPASNYEYYRVQPYWMFNSSIGLRVTEHFILRAIVRNVFNQTVTSAGTVPEFSINKEFDAVLGRSFRLSATVKF